MSTFDPAGLQALEEAATRETDAARRLTESLGRMRSAAEGLEVRRLEAELAEAEGATRDLVGAASLCSGLGAETARALGLSQDATLGGVAHALGKRGERLGRVARDLTVGLEALAQQAAALSICTRYGAAVSGHLLALAASAGASYGPSGRLAVDPAVRARRA